MSTGPRRNYKLDKRKSYKKYRVRCRFCHARRTLSKLPAFYARPRRCRCSGARKAHKEGISEWRIDWHRTARYENRANVCRCDGIVHRHRRGSTWLGARCNHAKAPAVTQGEPDSDVPF